MDEGSIFRHEPGSAEAQAAAAAALPAPAVEEHGSRAAALAAAVVALVGAATGYAVHRLGGTAITMADRVAACVLAAGGILLGKYVIFVHELKDALRDVFHTNPSAVGYFDTREMHFFVHNFTDIVRASYILWIGLAMFTAFRASGGNSVFGRRRT
jgi:hypothetical protein